MTEEELNKFLSDKEEQYGIEINYWTDSEMNPGDSIFQILVLWMKISLVDF